MAKNYASGVCSDADDAADDDDCFYIALFSALERTHCAFVAGDSK